MAAGDEAQAAILIAGVVEGEGLGEGLGDEDFGFGEGEDDAVRRVEGEGEATVLVVGEAARRTAAGVRVDEL